MDFTFTDLRQLAYLAACLHDVISCSGVRRITGELVQAVEYRAQLEEYVEATIFGTKNSGKSAAKAAYQVKTMIGATMSDPKTLESKESLPLAHPLDT